MLKNKQKAIDPVGVESTRSVVELARQIIDKNSTKFVSFDFFDTLVKRKAIVPTDIFYRIGDELQRSNILPSYVSIQRFAQERIAAERRARERLHASKGSYEVTLSEIYDCLTHIFRFPDVAKKALNIEIVVEKKSIFPNYALWDLMEYAIEKRKTVIVCSDTYFSSFEIKGLVNLPRSVRVWTSSENRSGKGELLFDIVIKELNIAPNAMLHMGDNYNSDVVSPAKRGIRSLLIPNGTSTSWSIIDDELRMSFPSRQVELGSEDFLSVGELVSLRHVSMLAGNLDSELTYRSFGSFVIGPMLYGYLEWVNSMVSAIKPKVVIGLMREGSILAEMFCKLYNYTDPVKMLYVSRIAISTAGIMEADRNELILLIPARQAISLSEFTKRIGLQVSDFPTSWKERPVTRMDAEFTELLLDRIVNSSILKSKVIHFAKFYRDRLELHVRDVVGPFESLCRNDLVFLDLGWAGTIQTQLSRIFSIPHDSICGLYLALNDGGLHNSTSFTQMGGYLFDGDLSGAFVGNILRSVEIIEQAFSPPTGSVIDYNEEGIPICADDKINQNQRRQSEELQAGVMDFCRVAALSNLNLSSPKLKYFLQHMIMRFCLSPTVPEVEIFKNWMHDDNLSGGALEWIIPRTSDRLIEYRRPECVLEESFLSTYWPTAATSYGARLVRDQALLQLQAKGGRKIFTKQTKLHVALVGDVGQKLTLSPGKDSPVELNILGKTSINLRFDSLSSAKTTLRFSAPVPTIIKFDLVLIKKSIRMAHQNDSVVFEGDGIPLIPVDGVAKITDSNQTIIVNGTYDVRLDLSHVEFLNNFSAGIEVVVCFDVAEEFNGVALRQSIERARSPSLLIANFDDINGIPFQDIASVDHDFNDPILKIKGWSYIKRTFSSSKDLILYIKNTSCEFSSQAVLFDRPDVVSSVPEISESEVGFMANFNMAEIQTGEYVIGLHANDDSSVVDFISGFHLSVHVHPAGAYTIGIVAPGGGH